MVSILNDEEDKFNQAVIYHLVGGVFKTATTQRSTSSSRLNQAFSFIKAQVTLRDKINYYTVRLTEKFSS